MDLPTDEELRYMRGMYDNSMSISALTEWWAANGSRLMITWIRAGFHKSGSDPDELSPELLQLIGIDVSQSGPAVPTPSDEEYAVLSAMINQYASESLVPGHPLIIRDQFRPYALWGGLNHKALLRKHLSPDDQGRTAEDDLRAKRRGGWPVEARFSLPHRYEVAPDPARALPNGILQVPLNLSLHRVGFGAGGREAMTGMMFKWGMMFEEFLAVFHREPEGWRVKEVLRNKTRFSYIPRPIQRR